MQRWFCNFGTPSLRLGLEESRRELCACPSGIESSRTTQGFVSLGREGMPSVRLSNSHFLKICSFALAAFQCLFCLFRILRYLAGPFKVVLAGILTKNRTVFEKDGLNYPSRSSVKRPGSLKHISEKDSWPFSWGPLANRPKADSLGFPLNISKPDAQLEVWAEGCFAQARSR